MARRHTAGMPCCWVAHGGGPAGTTAAAHRERLGACCGRHGYGSYVRYEGVEAPTPQVGWAAAALWDAARPRAGRARRGRGPHGLAAGRCQRANWGEGRRRRPVFMRVPARAAAGGKPPQGGARGAGGSRGQRGAGNMAFSASTAPGGGKPLQRRQQSTTAPLGAAPRALGALPEGLPALLRALRCGAGGARAGELREGWALEKSGDGSGKKIKIRAFFGEGVCDHCRAATHCVRARSQGGHWREGGGLLSTRGP